MRKKTILFVNYSMSMGGIESMLYNACLYFKSKGYIVEVLTFKSGGCYIERLRQNDILVHVREKNEGFDVALIVKLRRFLKNHKYDVIHSNNYASWLYITLSSLLIFCKFNIVHTEHWIEQINTKRRLFIEKLLSKFTKKVICVSDNILDV